ncbi:NADH-quinone oxidoreductase subunit NuoK [Frischella sp. Ac48]|uniref:NADH-quinone oxidoreductase subunit K n=1 Tax=Frischella japonica TaxID=2741544 RepID=A0ABR7QTZ9_9GAMM|nr:MULTISPECIES: NADH-quinone oxidoreductase subunit NuoK [Frischella]MBC9129704.1 NADH-quinone oxidoreductase subunit NuoK [Frischella japonica]MBX4132695.1 NADH-quinone oxidoreductase subunit NuoK [Frischella sp. Ac48]
MIPLMHSFIFAVSLFMVGLLGAMIRRNFFFLLLSLMIMINGAVIALVAAGAYWQQQDGQLIAMLAISTALAETLVGSALLIKMFYRRKTVNIDSLSDMKG